MFKIAQRAALLVAVAAGAFGASAANAATATDTFDVSVTITAACSVDASSSDIDLGTHQSTATDLGASSDITVKCSNTVPYRVNLSPSNGNTGGAGSLDPVGASPDTVPYQLRSASGMSGTVWGNTSSNGVTGTGTGADQTLTVYATAASANYAPDTYSDTVTVTVNY
ncbi:Csu type fimbrial protein [Alteraurantiacibacter buctensis]|uniref:Fimbrial major subunit CsuA/B family protein n=1 Tax=Alteraurantiacibacter buctensis TaxID=1503981 RepID=A0A844YQK3_9SPHN|nr:spore coat protein U domain-containing protein [Alteraurantiacibacter buctensis]MXO70615.1 fimbrial major subunit CsuA/B family protein [Alteraurantiacibacter buctensis]